MENLLAIFCVVLGATQQRSPWDFKGWSEFKVGSWVRMKTEVDLGGQKSESEFKGTLLETAEGQLIVEQTMANAPSKKWTFAKDAPDDKKWTSEGDEELDLGSKKMKCHWKEFKQGTNEFKMWFCGEIPGGVAKFLVKNPRTTVMMLTVEWEKK